MNVEGFHERLRELYLPPKDQFTIVDVPEIRYAVIDGKGDPGNGASAEAAKWLYAVVHFVKPFVKERWERISSSRRWNIYSGLITRETLSRGIKTNGTGAPWWSLSIG